MSLDEAIRNIHFPKNPELLRKAQYRLKFEELFYCLLYTSIENTGVTDAYLEVVRQKLVELPADVNFSVML